MPSRKRNKGKERKAKKAEMIETERAGIHSMWLGLARGLNAGGEKVIQCDHGVALKILDDENHPVTSFINMVFINRNAGKPMTTNLIETMYTHPQVCHNESYRGMTIDVMASIGTNWLLGNKSERSGVKVMAGAIMMLENYIGTGNNIVSTADSQIVASKRRDLATGNIRDVLKFFRKRIACSCLKKMHLDARKTLPKLGVCFCCDVVKERPLLMVCSRCRITQYCSSECQVAHWHRHKRVCDTCPYW